MERRTQRRGSNEIPTAKRIQVRERDHGRCQRCGGSGTAWHHRRGRSVRDEHTHDACNGVTLCDACHAWLHQHPAYAREKGFIVSRHEPTPSAVPIHTFHGLVVHTCDGTAEPFQVGKIIERES